jgi:sulfur-oxidizing protein SoxY
MTHGPMTRRGALWIGAGAAAILTIRPAFATLEDRAAAIHAFAGEAEIKQGRVKLDLPPLVENGNAAPLTVTVDSAMNEADFVRRIAIFNERNPQPNVMTMQLGPRAGRAAISTRIRLATSQRILAVAEMGDGSYWQDSADVIVTLAACVEG